MFGPARSLRRTLATRLLSWQLVVLIVITAFTGGMLYVADAGNNWFDLEVAEAIAEAVVVDGGSLRIEDSETLRRVRTQSPQFWFVAQDEAGRRLVDGPVPAAIEPLSRDLFAISRIEIIGSRPGLDGALLADESGPAGPVRTLFGGAPPPDWFFGMTSFVGREVAPLLAIVLVVVGGLTIFAIPRLVGGSLGSLDAVAQVAARIDIDQRGIRLPAEDVPTEAAALVSAVNAALTRLDRGYEEKQRFLADAAHELRTPIAILQNRIELRQDGEQDRRLLLDVHRLANLAEQLLDLQRVEHLQSQLTEIDLVAIGRMVMAELAPLAIAGGYDPVFDSQVDKLPLWGDASSMQRALINLVQNAIAHGGGRGEIVMSISSAGWLSISDDGPGVPEDRREWIFEPFHRIKPLNAGSGLGLSLVREILQHHNGSIAVEDNPGGGARFVIWFDRQKLRPSRS